MRLTKLITVLIVAATSRAALIVEHRGTEEFDLVDATINILKKCYDDRIRTLGIVESSSVHLSNHLSNHLSFASTNYPVSLMNGASRLANSVLNSVDPQSRHRLQVFVVAVTDISSLVRSLAKIKTSRWWNHMASFILLDFFPASSNRCFNAYEILWEAWKANLLDAIFICHHEIQGIRIYTHNPYTSLAPNPWKLDKTHIGINGHIWSLFSIDYNDDDDICEALDFDKTVDIGGYEIRASFTALDGWTNGSATIPIQAEAISALTLINSVNATWKIVLHPPGTEWSDENGEPFGPNADIVNGISDIMFNFANAYFSINNTVTYPHSSSGVIVVTQYRGHLSQLTKIVTVLDVTSRIGLFIVCLITFLFFKCHLCEPTSTAFLNLVRVVGNSSLLVIPEELATRIYLGSLFVFALTIQGIYQGQLASLLTGHVALPNVNGIDDLARFGYTIHGHRSFASCFNESAFEDRYVGSDDFACTDRVLSDEKAACAGEMLNLIEEAAKFKLHLSRQMIMTLYGVYLIRSDWPLEDRINKVLQRCFEADVIDSMINREARGTLNALEAYENQDQDRSFKIIVLRELSFAFAILGIGLAFSVLSFVVEVAIDGSALPTLERQVH